MSARAHIAIATNKLTIGAMVTAVAVGESESGSGGDDPILAGASQSTLEPNETRFFQYAARAVELKWQTPLASGRRDNL